MNNAQSQYAISMLRVAVAEQDTPTFYYAVKRQGKNSLCGALDAYAIVPVANNAHAPRIETVTMHLANLTDAEVEPFAGMTFRNQYPDDAVRNALRKAFSLDEMQNIRIVRI